MPSVPIECRGRPHGMSHRRFTSCAGCLPAHSQRCSQRRRGTHAWIGWQLDARLAQHRKTGARQCVVRPRERRHDVPARTVVVVQAGQAIERVISTVIVGRFCRRYGLKHVGRRPEWGSNQPARGRAKRRSRVASPWVTFAPNVGTGGSPVPSTRNRRCFQRGQASRLSLR